MEQKKVVSQSETFSGRATNLNKNSLIALIYSDREREREGERERERKREGEIERGEINRWGLK